MPKKPAKKKPGPQPKPAGERAKPLSTKFPPHVREWIAQQGDGSATRGLRLVVTAAYERATGNNSGK